LPSQIEQSRLFQSAPGGEAGGNARRGWAGHGGAGFNPPPAVRPGGTQDRSQDLGWASFQSAPGGEAGGNRASETGYGRTGKFQSAPGGEAGGNVRAEAQAEFFGKFQSAPGGEAGGNRSGWPISSGGASFNPPPAVRPGGTL